MLFGPQTMFYVKGKGLVTASELHECADDSTELYTGSGWAPLTNITSAGDLPLLNMSTERFGHKLQVSQNCSPVTVAEYEPEPDQDVTSATIAALLDAVVISGGRIIQDEHGIAVLSNKLDLRLALARSVNVKYGTDSSKAAVRTLHLRGDAARDFNVAPICHLAARASVAHAIAYIDELRHALSGTTLSFLPDQDALDRIATLAYIAGYDTVASQSRVTSFFSQPSARILFEKGCKRSGELGLVPRYSYGREYAAYGITLPSPCVVASGFQVDLR